MANECVALARAMRGARGVVLVWLQGVTLLCVAGCVCARMRVYFFFCSAWLSTWVVGWVWAWAWGWGWVVGCTSGAG